MLATYQRSNGLVIPESFTKSEPIPNAKNLAHLWSSKEDMVKLRRVFLCQSIAGYIPLWILIFIMCAFYFGAGVDPSRYTNHIDVNIIDADQEKAGEIFTRVFQSTSTGGQTLHWLFKDVNNDENRIRAVTNGKVWASVVLRANVTSTINRILNTLIEGNQVLEDPFKENITVQVIYEGGRNVFTQNNFILPPIRSALATFNRLYGQALRSKVIAMLSSASNTSIDRTLQRNNILRLSRLFSNPLPIDFNDMHPASPFVGQFATTLGYIYLFLVTTIIVRSTIGGIAPFVDKIHYRYVIAYRAFNGVFQSFMISLIYSLIVLWLCEIKSGEQFMRYWMFNWLSTLVLAIMVSFFMTNFGPFAFLFIVACVVVQVSAATIQIPLELSPRFFRYGYGMPLYHSMNGGRHLLFGSYSDFSLNVGVLIIHFVVLMALTISSAIFWTKKRQQ